MMIIERFTDIIISCGNNKILVPIDLSVNDMFDDFPVFL
jgi:hypothetical protein